MQVVLRTPVAFQYDNARRGCKFWKTRRLHKKIDVFIIHMNSACIRNWLEPTPGKHDFAKMLFKPLLSCLSRDKLINLVLTQVQVMNVRSIKIFMVVKLLSNKNKNAQVLGK